MRGQQITDHPNIDKDGQLKKKTSWYTQIQVQSLKSNSSTFQNIPNVSQNLSARDVFLGNLANKSEGARRHFRGVPG